ncbi:hypothetical protein SteCoe_33239 [Stentor coeruleus]|uniref:Uncharacterized protein n=1 Tax=Stentor coeruleus TaxID=5963 RepID=A0A1R2AX76_9CILI|nr:hypothetical protein SteCoe_33239 [Stentor coeruleus]
MIISLILYSTLASSIKFPQEFKPEKMQACYNIIEYKLYKDQEFLNNFFSQFQDPDFAINYYTADMLLKCYTAITIQEAEEVLIQGENIYLAPYLEDLVKVDIEFYAGGMLDVNSDHQALYQEIQNIINSQEGQGIKEDNNEYEQSPIGVETLIFITVVCICTIVAYLTSGKTENGPEDQKKE